MTIYDIVYSIIVIATVNGLAFWVTYGFAAKQGKKEGWAAGFQDRKLWRANDEARHAEAMGELRSDNEDLEERIAAVCAEHLAYRLELERMVAVAQADRDKARNELDESIEGKARMIGQNFRLAKRMDDAEIENRKVVGERDALVCQVARRDVNLGMADATIDGLKADNARLIEENERMISELSGTVKRSTLMPVWVAFAELQDAIWEAKRGTPKAELMAVLGPMAVGAKPATGGIGTDVDLIREHLTDQECDDDDFDDDDNDDDDIELDDADFLCPDCGLDDMDCDCDLDDLDDDDDDIDELDPIDVADLDRPDHGGGDIR